MSQELEMMRMRAEAAEALLEELRDKVEALEVELAAARKPEPEKPKDADYQRKRSEMMSEMVDALMMSTPGPTRTGTELAMEQKEAARRHQEDLARFMKDAVWDKEEIRRIQDSRAKLRRPDLRQPPESSALRGLDAKIRIERDFVYDRLIITLSYRSLATGRQRSVLETTDRYDLAGKGIGACLAVAEQLLRRMGKEEGIGYPPRQTIEFLGDMIWNEFKKI